MVKCLLKSFAQFLTGLLDFLLLCSENSLYILDTDLSDMQLESIFSQSVASVSTLLLISHRASICDEVPFINFSMDYAFGVRLSAGSRRISLIFSSKSVTVFHSSFRSMTHFECIFV